MTDAPLVERVFSGDPRAIARAMTLLENDEPGAKSLIGQLYPRSGRAHVVGLTGPPGAGKSTLVDALTAHYRAAGLRVGVIAVDPTSPFSGGAVLGDRVRMQRHASDPGVFVRSMAARGHLGGLAGTTADLVLVLDAAGVDVVIVETVGVGQGEVDVVRLADTCVVVLVPGAGDEIQALKAGIMEIADVFVVNKSDREGADRVVAAIESNLALHVYAPDEWRPPIVKTCATDAAGIADLAAEIERHRGEGGAAVEERRRIGAAFRLRTLIAGRFLQHVERDVVGAVELEQLADRVARREIDPYAAADLVIERAIGRAAVRPVE